MSTAELIVKVAKARNQANIDHDSPILDNDIAGHSSDKAKSQSKIATQALSRRDRWSGNNFATSQARAHGIELSNMASGGDDADPRNIYTTREVHVEFEKASQRSENSGPSYYDGPPAKGDEEDTRPLKSDQGGAVHVRINSN
ncbi:hypothetical protein AB5N19_01102 [Seiridium cardinale]